MLCGAPNDPRTPSIWIELYLHMITHEHFNSVQAHFAGQICQDDGLALRYLHTKKGVWERLIHDAFDNLWFSHTRHTKSANSCK